MAERVQWTPKAGRESTKQSGKYMIERGPMTDSETDRTQQEAHKPIDNLPGRNIQTNDEIKGREV